MRSIGAPSRHKIAKIDELIKNPRWLPVAILKIKFRHLFPNLWSICAQTCSAATRQLDRNELKSCQSEIQDGHHSHHLKNLFWTSRKPQADQVETNNVLHNIFDNKNIHFRSKTSQKQSVWVSFSTGYYEDVYPNTAFCNETPIGLPRKMPIMKPL